MEWVLAILLGLFMGVHLLDFARIRLVLYVEHVGLSAPPSIAAIEACRRGTRLLIPLKIFVITPNVLFRSLNSSKQTKLFPLQIPVPRRDHSFYLQTEEPSIFISTSERTMFSTGANEINSPDGPSANVTSMDATKNESDVDAIQSMAFSLNVVEVKL